MKYLTKNSGPWLIVVFSQNFLIWPKIWRKKNKQKQFCSKIDSTWSLSLTYLTSWGLLLVNAIMAFPRMAYLSDCKMGMRFWLKRVQHVFLYHFVDSDYVKNTKLFRFFFYFFFLFSSILIFSKPDTIKV